MTREDIEYVLSACGCLYKDGYTYYEHEELIKCFEDLGYVVEEQQGENT